MAQKKKGFSLLGRWVKYPTHDRYRYIWNKWNRLQVKLSNRLGMYASVFHAEIYTILLRAITLMKRSYKNLKISLVTVSQQWGSWETASDSVADCICKFNELTLIELPGHSVWKYREADMLQKGRDQPFMEPEPTCEILLESKKKQEVKPIAKIILGQDTRPRTFVKTYVSNTWDK